MSTTYGDPDFKQCPSCGEIYPRNTKYFYRAKSRTDGLSGICKKCNTVKQRERRKQVKKLPAQFSEEDINRAMLYFHGHCAVCNRPLRDLFGDHVPAMDHWIPLSHGNCPGTVSWNMVPLCHGTDGCNNKKHNLAPDEWLEREYGTKVAEKILARINEYFDWVKSGNTLPVMKSVKQHRKKFIEPSRRIVNYTDDISITEVEFSARLFRSLWRIGIRTIGEAKSFVRSNPKPKTHGIGPKFWEELVLSINEIERTGQVNCGKSRTILT